MRTIPYYIDAILNKVLKHNNMPNNTFTVEECEKTNNWTPCDLIIREWLNNGGESARGFLGIEPEQCKTYYKLIVKYKDELIKLGYISKDAWNNSGIMLWENYNF